MVAADRKSSMLTAMRIMSLFSFFVKRDGSDLSWRYPCFWRCSWSLVLYVYAAGGVPYMLPFSCPFVVLCLYVPSNCGVCHT